MTGLLVSPITWAHHLVWVVPIILWLAFAHDRPAFGRLWAALAAAWFWCGPIWRIPHGSGVELHDTLAQLLVGNSYTLAMLLFVGGMIVMLALRHRRGSGVGTRGQVSIARQPGLPEDNGRYSSSSDDELTSRELRAELRQSDRNRLARPPPF